VTWAQSHAMTLPSGANLREHALARARRARDHRQLGFLLVASNDPPALPVTVTLVRVAPRPLDDDNLAFAFKSVRDGVADAFGIRDDDARIRFEYRQEKGAAAVRVEIARRA
jgi:hypothetical protein